MTTSAELAVALASPTRSAIVLADGVYDNPGPFRNYGDHALYAERVGGAVLQAGLWMGGNFGTGGGLVRGLVFDVSDPAKAPDRAILHLWGPAGVNTQILDCVFRGGGVVENGVLAFSVQGLRAERLQISGFAGTGMRVSDNQTVPYGSATPQAAAISDISIADVSRPVPGSSSGTAEAGLWVGHPVTAGVSRIRIRNVSWSGIEIVNNAWNTTYSDLDIDMSGPLAYRGVGVYLEHYSYANVFQRFRITGSRRGFLAEWADPAWGGAAAAHGTVIRDGLIDAAGWRTTEPLVGVFLDEGTESTTVTGVVFRNQNWAAIGAYRTTGTSRFEGNDYGGLAGGAVSVSANSPANGAP